MKIPLTRPWFDADDLAAVQAPLETGWVVQGPHVRAFEQSFAAYTGADDAVACTSCTTALHLALAALGVGPGDEVIVPAFTWVATANAAIYCGATPVLVDIDLPTFALDPAAVEAAITARTRAVVPVHLFGLAADMDALVALAERRGLSLLEDAACGLGSRHRGRHVGTIGDMGVFSFHPRKAVTTGEGGMVLAREAHRLDRCRVMRNHGASAKAGADVDGFRLGDFAELGFNYRMTDIQGALGVTQMKKVPAAVERRTRLARRYDTLLAPLGWLRTPAVPAYATHSYQSYVCLFAPEEPTLERLPTLEAARDRVMRFAAEQGVATRQGTHAVHTLGYYARTFGYAPGDMPRAAIAERASLTLPLYPQMTEAEQDYVVETLRTAADRI